MYQTHGYRQVLRHSQRYALLHLARSRAISMNSQTPKSIPALSSALPTTSSSSVLATSFRDRIQCYHELSKTKLSALVVMTTASGFLVAGGPINWMALTSVTLGTSLAAASANTFNQVWEIKPDKLMQRTFQRPLPSGRISQTHALAWGASTGLASTAILAAGCNPLTAALGAFNIGLYSLVYTPMKTRMELNTWMGSIVGAIPPLMGYTAATGTLAAPEALLVGSILYLWQFPHFFALSWRLRKDYARGGFKMVPCNDPAGIRTSGLVSRYAAYLAPVPILAAMSGVTSWMFAVEGSVMNAYLMYLSRNFSRQPNNHHAKQVFLCSLWYLPALLGCMVFHSQNWNTREETVDANAWLMNSKLGLATREVLDPLGFQSVPQVVQDTRTFLKELCIHEYLWTSDTTASISHESNRSSSMFCPVVVTDTVVDQASSATLAQLERSNTSTQASGLE